MEDFPRTILAFEERFSTEDACREYLAVVRWPDGFRCPECGHGKAWLTTRKLYHCAHCGHQTSVTAGTVFQDTRKPLRLWFRAMWYVTSQKHGISALGLQRVLGLGSYHTAWAWLHKLRRAMVRPGRDRLQGLVEADETYIGGSGGGVPGGGAVKKHLVLIAVEVDGRALGRIRMRRAADASADSLCGALAEAVETGTVIRTDGWSAYRDLQHRGYAHQVTRPMDVVGEDELPRVHQVASLLKRWLLGTHQGAVQPSHLDYYLDEFTFRFNRRKSASRGKLFYRLVQQALQVDPVPEKLLRAAAPD